MPTIDYTCQCCGHSFKRVILMDQEPPLAACPRCKAPEVKPIRGSTGLFNGIAPFSRLANDTN
jgi:putative FmdB family regulatory protein